SFNVVLLRPLSLRLFSYFFLTIIPRPPRPTLFPYTTLFRSLPRRRYQELALHHPDQSQSQPVALAFAQAFVLAARGERRLARKRSEEHTSELQSQSNLVCRLLLEKKKKKKDRYLTTESDNQT